MLNNLLVLPRSGVTVRRRRRLAPILGREYPKPLGYVFAPIYHNWTYAFTPEAIQKFIDKFGLGETNDMFEGLLMEEKLMDYFGLKFAQKVDPFAVDPHALLEIGRTVDQQMTVNVHGNFKRNVLPRLDAGMKQASLLGSIQFLIILLILGANVGFNSKFVSYIIANILTTEATSYVIHEYSESEVSGNSIFGYTNYTMCFLLFSRQGFRKSSWALTLVTFMAVMDFISQFTVPAASKPLHGLGILVGWLWYYYGYGFK